MSCLSACLITATMMNIANQCSSNRADGGAIVLSTELINMRVNWNQYTDATYAVGAPEAVESELMISAGVPGMRGVILVHARRD